jgi:hypothetical protein
MCDMHGAQWSVAARADASDYEKLWTGDVEFRRTQVISRTSEWKTRSELPNCVHLLRLLILFSWLFFGVLNRHFYTRVIWNDSWRAVRKKLGRAPSDDMKVVEKSLWKKYFHLKIGWYEQSSLDSSNNQVFVNTHPDCINIYPVSSETNYSTANSTAWLIKWHVWQYKYDVMDHCLCSSNPGGLTRGE